MVHIISLPECPSADHELHLTPIDATATYPDASFQKRSQETVDVDHF